MPMSGRTARFIWPELQSQYIEYTGKKIQNEHVSTERKMHSFAAATSTDRNNEFEEPFT